MPKLHFKNIFKARHLGKKPSACKVEKLISEESAHLLGFIAQGSFGFVALFH